MRNDVYLFYSGATDTTGAKLAEKLDISHGKTDPKAGIKMLIGWGAKTDGAIKLGKDVVVLNHPDKIRANRNKLEALTTLQKAGVTVAPFVDATSAEKELTKAGGKIQTPCIGRTAYHQGGAGFFTCLTPTHVKKTIAEFTKMGKKGYFQNYIDVETEYRLHVFGDKCIVAAKKVERTDLEEAHVEQQKEKIATVAEKKGAKLDDKTLEFALKYQAGKIAGADQIIKSNTRGWKFVPVKEATVPKGLVAEAIKAVKALGLHFGAVDCVVDAQKKPWVIEVNTGPGLEGTAFDAYADAFIAAIREVFAPVKTTATKTVKTEVGAKPATLATAIKNTDDIQPDQLRAIAALLDGASPEERRHINSAARKMFGG